MSKICCFTGSRNVSRKALPILMKKLESEIENLIINEGYTDFRTGGALGFDTVAALSVLKLRDRHPHIKLHLILPCRNQEKYYTVQYKKIYRAILALADTQIFMQERYTDGVMFARNRALVDGSDICIAYLTKSHGGTYYTVQYAKKQGVPVINVSSV